MVSGDSTGCLRGGCCPEGSQRAPRASGLGIAALRIIALLSVAVVGCSKDTAAGATATSSSQQNNPSVCTRRLSSAGASPRCTACARPRRLPFAPTTPLAPPTRCTQPLSLQPRRHWHPASAPALRPRPLSRAGGAAAPRGTKGDVRVLCEQHYWGNAAAERVGGKLARVLLVRLLLLLSNQLLRAHAAAHGQRSGPPTPASAAASACCTSASLPATPACSSWGTRLPSGSTPTSNGRRCGRRSCTETCGAGTSRRRTGVRTAVCGEVVAPSGPCARCPQGRLSGGGDCCCTPGVLTRSAVHL